MAKTTVGVKLDDETRDRLRRLGAAKRRSTHWMVKEAVSQYVESEERYEREKAEDSERWERYLATAAALSNEEVVVWLDRLAEEAGEKAQTG